MKQIQTTEPPSCPQPSSLQSKLFMVGRDSHGNWVVQDQGGMRGGLFVGRAEALRFVRSENDRRSEAFVPVAGIFELDMSRAAAGELGWQDVSYNGDHRWAA